MRRPEPRGVTRLIGSVDVGLLAYGARVWFDLKPLGLPVVYPEGGAAVGYEIPVTDDLIERMKRAHGLSESSAFERSPDATLEMTPARLERAYRAKAPRSMAPA